MAVFLKELETIRETSRSKQQPQPQQQQQQQQPSSQPSPTITNPTPAYQEPNRCYICFGTEEDSVGRWVKPCQCTLISHEDCLLDWIDKNRQQFAKKQTGLPLIPVILIFSRTKIIDSFMPLIPLLIVGNDQLQVTFPPSPALTLSVMPWVRMAYNSLWAEMVTRLEMRWRQQQIAGSGVARLGMNASIDSADVDPSTAAATTYAANAAEEELSFFDRKDLGRTIVGALLMPAISSICGSFLGHFSFVRMRIPDNFHRNILGGCLFVVIKDLAGLVGTYQEMKRRRVRRIREYSEFKDERQ
ncbi:hypothetical protein BGX26_004765 [Mortierella sp. AD094]|nr:hypothetical protein BGX26_004765 [Mortierella sp. AD094]